MNGSFHRLADNQDISHEEYAKLAALLDEIRALHLGVPGYIARHELSPEVFLPSATWGTISEYLAAPTWTYDLANRVRAIAPFTGYETMMWGRQDGDIDMRKREAFYRALFGGQISPLDLDGVLDRDFMLGERMYRSCDQLVSSYDALAARVPGRYHLPTPARGGTIGIRHRGRVLNQDLLTYQDRLNALYGSGVLDRIEQAATAGAASTFLEIGPGHCFFAWALRECLCGHLRVFLVDLPSSMLYGCAYLACVAGSDAIGIVTAETRRAIDKPFVLIPNHLVPAYSRYLPALDLVHNAISLNEMSLEQVRYYVDFIRAHLSEEGAFHLSGGQKVLPSHVDALAEAIRRFSTHKLYPADDVEGIRVGERPNSFFFRD